MSIRRGNLFFFNGRKKESIGQNFKRRSVLEKKTSNIKFPHPSEILKECSRIRKHFSSEPITIERSINKGELKTEGKLLESKQAHSISLLSEGISIIKNKDGILNIYIPEKKYNASMNRMQCYTSRKLLSEKTIQATLNNGKNKKKANKKLLATSNSLSNTSISKFFFNSTTIKEKLDRLKCKIEQAFNNYAEREEAILEYTTKLKRENDKLKKLLHSS